jgi:putative sterol carrier protein
MRSNLKTEAAHGVRETYEFHIDEETFHVTVEDGEVGILQGPAVEPDLVLIGSTRAFLDLAAGQIEPAEAIELGAFRIEGEQEVLARCLEMFGLPVRAEEISSTNITVSSEASDRSS